MNNCELCGEPMPEGEQAFRYHGFSGPCPKPPSLEQQLADAQAELAALRKELSASRKAMWAALDVLGKAMGGEK